MHDDHIPKDIELSFTISDISQRNQGIIEKHRIFHPQTQSSQCPQCEKANRKGEEK